MKLFGAFRFRNYRLWFIGQLASLIGTWMQATAQGYLIFQLTHSPAYLGYVGFASGFPSLLTLVGGIASDRFSKKNVLLIAQVVMMILAIILSFLTYIEKIEAWHIILLSFFLGIANAFDAPARQSLVSELVDQDHLTNAIALNSSMFNLARTIGPAIAGITYSFLGPAWCFLINALSFLAVILALLLIKTSKRENTKLSQKTVLNDFREGFIFAYENKTVRILLLIIFISSIFGLGYVTLVPAWAVNILKGDASTVGSMQAIQGLGSFLGALFVASIGNIHYRGKLLVYALFSFPFILFIFSVIRFFPLVLVTLFIGGFGFMIVFNLANAIIQRIVPNHLRGRVMSLYTFGFLGALPIGSLFMGTLAEYTSEPFSILVSSACMFIFVIWIWIYTPYLRQSPN
ncbi:MAG TPA: MFS transporter [Leptospiraceae bacterium]|nr:MFS transporter [Leptospiraceae bacterium]HMW04965.1 MFS transporter [Leptospiraceae bacterium]HMX31886.1 MFS transporter [Leptospiraceae bacterium]HMY30814.1 MFS transporter [Leptospiraceae bacterium]HMZ64275.1 MFS transporter [Leptospiraceae bacterium]